MPFFGAYLSRTDNTVREQITDNFVAEHLQYQTSIIVFFKVLAKKIVLKFFIISVVNDLRPLLFIEGF